MKAMSIIGIIVFFFFFLAAYNILNDTNLNVGDTVTVTESNIAMFQGRQMGNILVGLFGMAYAIVGTVHAFRKKSKKKTDIPTTN
jgi:hypothetical protein